MNGSTTIRRSPIVLIRTFVIIEFLGFVGYWLLAALGNYKYELYAQLSLTSLLSYQIAKFLFLSGAQLVITIYAFFRWYYETYTFRPDAVMHEWGVFFKKKKSVMPQKTMSATLSVGPIGKLFHYGSVSVSNGGSNASLTLSDISYPKKHYAAITRIIKNPVAALGDRPDIPSLLKEDEHDQLEFKSSLRFDHAAGNVNIRLEKAALKTVAAFMNSRGGRLVLGVDNSKNPVGLEYDYKTLQRKSSDGFENHFTQIFNKAIGPEMRSAVKLWFSAVSGRDICVVDVAPASRPIYLKLDDNEHFYVRTGNITTALKLSEIDAYAASRWPRRRQS